ncbi:MAG: hypothetical protein FWG27_04840 [Treponema sp.]|nr:hypothetical protein [Treponema sp.]
MRERSVITGIFTLVFLFSCSEPDRERDTPVPKIQFDPPPAREQRVFQILDHKKQDEEAVMAPWFQSYLENGISGPESMADYQGSYLFVASIRSTNLTVIDQWLRIFSSERDFSRLAAERIQHRLNRVSGNPPDVVYGSNYTRAVKAAHENVFWGTLRVDDTWVFGSPVVTDEDAELQKPLYWGFILVSIPRETLEIQVLELLAKITTSPAGRGRMATREQNAAFNQVRERFFEDF